MGLGFGPDHFQSQPGMSLRSLQNDGEEGDRSTDEGLIGGDYGRGRGREDPTPSR